MSGLREKIARAMCGSEGFNPESGRASDGSPLWRQWIPQSDAALATFREWLAENGLVVVPREATEEMLVRGGRSADDFRSQPGPYPRTKAVWKSMIAAAPDALGEK